MLSAIKAARFPSLGKENLKVSKNSVKYFSDAAHSFLQLHFLEFCEIGVSRHLEPPHGPKYTSGFITCNNDKKIIFNVSESGPMKIRIKKKSDIFHLNRILLN